MNIIENILTCPNCFNKLIKEGTNLLRSNCKREYSVIDDTFVMLAENSNDKCENRNLSIEEKRYKKDLMEFYSQMAKNLNSSILGRFTEFLNFGYVNNENKQYAVRDIHEGVMNKNSIK